MTSSTLVLPDRRYRRPRGAPGGAVSVGSDAHKTLFCRTLLDTFDPYRPAVLDWPELGQEMRDRLVALPIWDIAVPRAAPAFARFVRRFLRQSPPAAPI